MEIIAISLTILYLIFATVSEFIVIYLAYTDKALLTKEKFDKISIIENICRVTSYAIVILDVILILVVLL